MSDVKGRHFEGEIVLWAVRWYCRYGISYRDLEQMMAEGKCPEGTEHRQVKYLNNVVEADHGKLKQLIRLVRGFKTLKTAYATIKGHEVMRGEARLVERAFKVGPCVLAEAAQFISQQLELQDA